MPIPDLNRIRYFVAIVDAGSLSAAADQLGKNKGVVSHQLRKLERELKTTLVVRTTRKMRLTDSGSLFYESCLKILEEAENALTKLTERADKPSGHLTVTAPLDIGMMIVPSTLSEFMERYPWMTASLICDDRTLDFVDHNIDISIRVGWLDDSSAIARRIASFRQLPVCSPEHLKTTGGFDKPSDLERASWIANGALATPLKWTFSRGSQAVEVSGRAVVTANETLATHTCALAGLGVAVLPDFTVRNDLEANRLVHLVPEWHLPEGGIYTVMPPGRYRSAKVSAFAEIFAQQMKKQKLR